MEAYETSHTSSPDKQVKFKKNESDSDRLRSNCESSFGGTSSDSGSEKEKKLRRKFDIEYKTFSRSKSTSGLFKPKKEIFPVVREENNEEDQEVPELKDKEQEARKFHFLTEKIKNEGYDNIEETLLEHKPKKYTKSTKALSLMDPVIEVTELKEDIDFEELKIAPFKKLRLLTDFEEDKKIRNINTDTASLHIPLNNNYDYDEAIEEDNRENDIDVDKKKERKISSLKRVTDFIDRSDMIDELKSPRDIITEEIKEDPEHEENILDLDDIVTTKKCK